MDFGKAENHWPTFKNTEEATALKEYQIKFYKDKKERVNYLESYLRNSRINSKVLLHNSIIVLFKKHIKGVCRENVFNVNKLITAVSNIICYILPHHWKFVAHGASLPTVYNHLFLFNDSSCHKHKIPKICREDLMNFVGSVTACLEKSFTTRQSFKRILGIIGKLNESCSKYHDYLESNLTAVSEYQSLEEPYHIEAVVELPHLDGPLDGKYKNKRELFRDENLLRILGIPHMKVYSLVEICVN